MSEVDIVWRRRPLTATSLLLLFNRYVMVFNAVHNLVPPTAKVRYIFSGFTLQLTLT